MKTNTTRSAAARLACALVLALAAGSPGASAQTLPEQQPMERMRGDCGAFSWNLEPEFALWTGTAVRAAASVDPGGATDLPAGQLVELTLEPHADVTFAATPEQDRGAPDRFSGLALLSLDEAGVYRVSASNGLWIDLVSDGSVVESERFEMQTSCDRIFKSVAYAVEQPGTFVLQFSGSASETVSVLVTRWTE